MDWLQNLLSHPWAMTGAAFGVGVLFGLGMMALLGDRKPPVPEKDREKYLLEAQLRGKLEELRRISLRNDELTNFSINFPQRVHELNAALNATDLTNILSRACTAMLGTRSIQVFLLDRTRQELVLAQAVEDGVELSELKGQRLPAGEAPQSVLLEQATVRDASALRSHYPEMADPEILLGGKRFPIERVVALRTRQGVIGLLNLSWLPPGESSDQSQILGCLGQVAAMSLENLKSIDQARQEARLDLMTRLLNHDAFQKALVEALDLARPTGRSVAVFLFDLDNFKHYNDYHGHPAGDALLKTIAELFRTQLRPSDIAARYGGEEFAAVIRGCTKEQGLIVAERIRSAIERAHLPHAEEQPLGRITISGGVAAYPDDNADAENLVKSADVALYRAKKTGRNRVLAFENKMLEVNL